jgi:Glyoxalase/Bleomycin resistance protein/Dioxygenase superfamily
VSDLVEYGQKIEHSWRVGATVIGRVQWELIQPLDNEGMYARFLAEKGEGVHHVALATRDFDKVIAKEAERGHDLVGSGELGGTRVAYLATDRNLGVITEIFSQPPPNDNGNETKSRT